MFRLFVIRHGTSWSVPPYLSRPRPTKQHSSQLQDDKQFSLHGEWSPWVNMGPSRPAITTPITPPSRSEDEPDTFDYRSAIYTIPNAWRRYLPEDAIIDVMEHDR